METETKNKVNYSSEEIENEIDELSKVIESKQTEEQIEKYGKSSPTPLESEMAIQAKDEQKESSNKKKSEKNKDEVQPNERVRLTLF